MVVDGRETRPLYRLGEWLIEWRLLVSVVVLVVTAFFAYHMLQLRMITSFGDLLPQSHEFIGIHNQYSGTFGGANNIVVMAEAAEGSIFTVETLTKVYRMTDEIDKVYGVNHNQIDSIGHRTTRYIKVAAAGTMRSEPVMIGLPKTPEDAADIRRIVHNSENIYGILVSLDDKAALIRANFIEGRLDYKRIFREINARVVVPFQEGWVGALVDDLPEPRQKALTEMGVSGAVVVRRVFPDTAAAAAGLAQGDVITAVNGRTLVATRRVRRGVEDIPDSGRESFGALIAAAGAGEGVTLSVLRKGAPSEVSLTVPAPNIQVSIAGEPRLYGWVYEYSNEIIWIFAATAFFVLALVYFYFHDWRGALRPTLTGLISAIWGLGFINLIGFALDPLALVIPFFITARAVSHSIQMHDRYYEEYHAVGWNKERAIVAAFAELFVPTLSGIVTDALGILVILLVPILMLQKLAISASVWILAITISELLLNPIVYYYLRAPERETVERREVGTFKRIITRYSQGVVAREGVVGGGVVAVATAVAAALGLVLFTIPLAVAFAGIAFVTAFLLHRRGGRAAVLVGWSLLFLFSANFWRDLVIGDPTAASPLLWVESPYNRSHTGIQQRFGGVEPLIVVSEGYDKDAMKDPDTIRTMEKFQRYLERDPDVGYSFSLADILRAVNSVLHELEPKWGVVPSSWMDIGGLFFVFFSGSPPTETAKYVTPDYKTAHVTFYCKNHKGDNIRRIIHRCNTFIGETARSRLGFDVADDSDGVRVTEVRAGTLAEEYGLRVGDVILDTQPSPLPPKGLFTQMAEGVSRRLFGWPVATVADLDDRLRSTVASAFGSTLIVQRDGAVEEVGIKDVAWKGAFRLAGGLVGVLAAANQEILTNDILMNVLGFGTIYIIVLFTYRSWAAGLYLLAPLFVANGLVNAYMGARNIGININTLPVVTVGIGFGIDYGLYIVSRVIEEYRRSGDMDGSVRYAIGTAGKAVSFTALTLILGTMFWYFSNIRFDAEMGLLLALWMFISFSASMSLLPVLIAVFRPRFIQREGPAAAAGR